MSKSDRIRLLLCCQAAFDAVNYVPEGIRVVDDEVGEYFSVKANVGFFEIVHKNAIRNAFFFDCFANSCNPKSSKVPFSNFSAVECVRAFVQERFFCDFCEPTFCAAKTFGLSQNLLVFSS